MESTTPAIEYLTIETQFNLWIVSTDIQTFRSQVHIKQFTYS